MSVLLEFSMFPTDKGDSVSAYVSRIIDYVRKTGYDYKLTAMGTIIETAEVKEALQIVEEAHMLLATDCKRIYTHITMDVQQHKDHRLAGKIQSIEDKIGKVNT